MENVTSDLLTDILLDSIIFIEEIYMQMQFLWNPCLFPMRIFQFYRHGMYDVLSVDGYLSDFLYLT